MKQLLTLTTCLSFATLANAQCENLPIPFTAVQISTSGTTGIDAASVWVCGGLDVTIIGTLLNVYVEEASFVQIIGNYNQVYVKGGCTVNYQGDSSLVFYHPTTIVNSTSMSVLTAPCLPMTFDYTNAPEPPCTGFSGIGETPSPAIDLQLQPNPAEDHVSVRIDRGIIRSVSALDMSGREVLHADAPGDGNIDVSGLLPGQYLLRVTTDQGPVLSRFSKR